MIHYLEKMLDLLPYFTNLLTFDKHLNSGRDFNQIVDELPTASQDEIHDILNDLYIYNSSFCLTYPASIKYFDSLIRPALDQKRYDLVNGILSASYFPVSGTIFPFSLVIGYDIEKGNVELLIVAILREHTSVYCADFNPNVPQFENIKSLCKEYNHEFMLKYLDYIEPVWWNVCREDRLSISEREIIEFYKCLTDFKNTEWYVKSIEFLQLEDIQALTEILGDPNLAHLICIEYLDYSC